MKISRECKVNIRREQQNMDKAETECCRKRNRSLFFSITGTGQKEGGISWPGIWIQWV